MSARRSIRKRGATRRDVPVCARGTPTTPIGATAIRDLPITATSTDAPAISATAVGNLATAGAAGAAGAAWAIDRFGNVATGFDREAGARKNALASRGRVCGRIPELEPRAARL